MSMYCIEAKKNAESKAVATPMWYTSFFVASGCAVQNFFMKNFIKNKRAECAELSKIPHPAEFDKYYNL